jgi:hypothetical protein
VIIYCCCLALMVYRRRRRLATEPPLGSKQITDSPSLVSDSQTSIATTKSNMTKKPDLLITIPPRSHLSHVPPSLAPTTPSVYSTRTSVYAGVVEPEPKSAWSEKTRSARLSKPVPNWGFAY